MDEYGREVVMPEPMDEWAPAWLSKLERATDTLETVHAYVDPQIDECVYVLRFPNGGNLEEQERAVPWELIGQALHTTGEAARQRFGKRVKDRYAEDVKRWARGEGTTWFGASDEEKAEDLQRWQGMARVELARLNEEES